MRDGVEDFELLRMAESVLGKEATMAYVNKVTTSATEFVSESEVFDAVRADLMRAIEAATRQ